MRRWEDFARTRHALVALTAILFQLPIVGCTQQEARTSARQIGDASRGASLISYYGCGACHSIPGVSGADALVGPPLDHFSHRIYIAGVLHNSPDNLVLWIRNPQTFVPGNAMPALGIDNRDAHDIAAYLYSIE
jgi:cytochrome c2